MLAQAMLAVILAENRGRDMAAGAIPSDPVNLVAVNGVAVALGQTTGAASIPVVLPSDQGGIPLAAGSAVIGKVGIDQTTPGTTNRVQSGGTKIRVSTAKTRPADTTAYAAKDAISESTSAGTVWTFTGIARTTGGSGYIVKASLLTDQTTCTEAFRLHLFNAAPTAINDNSPCTAPLYANTGTYVGTIDFPAAKTEGTGSTAAYANATPNTLGCLLPLGFVTNADANLYGILETPAGFTPASGQGITIILQSEVD